MYISINLTDEQVQFLLRQLGYPDLKPIKSKKVKIETDKIGDQFNILDDE